MEVPRQAKFKCGRFPAGRAGSFFDALRSSQNKQRLVNADNHPLPRIVITGAANGVGRACAIAFAQLRADLILCDNDHWGLLQVAAETRAFARVCDVASETSLGAFTADVLAEFRTLDVLINAAGSGYIRSLGMMRTSRLLLPGLRRGSGGKLIVSVGPPPGLGDCIGLFPHASSETAFGRLSEAIALQARGWGIQSATLIAGNARARNESNGRCQGPNAAIVIPLEGLDTHEISQRIVNLACEHVPALDCEPRPLRRRA